jgi:hypothetical protein
MNPLIFQKNTHKILYRVFCSKLLTGLVDTKPRESIIRIQNKKFIECRNVKIDGQSRILCTNVGLCPWHSSH